MGTLNVDFITDRTQSFSISAASLKGRVIKAVSAEYTAGEFNPDNTYRFIPGASASFTPNRVDTIIRFRCRLPMAWSNAAHAISSMAFIANGVYVYQWSQSMTYYENGCDFEFEVPSWGTTAADIGLAIRSHANNNNEVRVYRTYYWNGASSVQTANGHLWIEEVYI